MIGKRYGVFLLGGILTLLLIGVWFARRPAQRAPADDSPSSRSQSAAGVPAASGAIDAAQARMRSQSGPAARQQALAGLKEYLFGLPRELAVAEMVDFLERSGDDVQTGMQLVVAGDGHLGSASSLRVAVLDWLGQIDKKRAGEVSRKILESPSNPDEWAIGLRNVAWAEPSEESHSFLRAKTIELIENEEWRVRPTSGYLEAFDVLVHTCAVDSAPLLAELVTDRSRGGAAASHAAYMTLDRLVISSPVEMLGRLVDDAERFAGREEMLAQMLARADFAIPEQRAIASSYLLDPARTDTELEAFASVFPNANYLISESLLTKSHPPSGSERIARDRAALEEIEAWIDREEYARIRPWLMKIHRRLSDFVDGE